MAPPWAPQRLITARIRKELNCGHMISSFSEGTLKNETGRQRPIWTSSHFTAACSKVKGQGQTYQSGLLTNLSPVHGPRSLDDRRWERLEGLGTSFQEDDSSISQTLIKQSKVTICGPQPAQRPSCSDKVRQVVHQSGELDPLSHHSVSSGCWNAQSLVLSGGAGGRNKDGCEPSLEDPCREIRGVHDAQR